jgi:methylthioribulose-1-phosphate dehydratase
VTFDCLEAVMPEQESRAKPPVETTGFAEIAAHLAELGRNFYRRGWVLGTSGNFSAVVSLDPWRLAITTSGVDKGALTAAHILQVNARGEVVAGSGRPSDETQLHLAVAQVCDARAILHTHSVWSTILSEAHAGAGGLSITGYEMLKGLAGVRTHEHREWLPVIENSQDLAALARTVEERLTQHPGAHGFLLRRHGLYTWGQDLAEAKRHVEIFEFLLEAVGRTERAAGPETDP